MSVKNIKKNRNGDRIISFFVKEESTCTKYIFISLLSQRMLGACTRTNDQTSMHLFPRWKDSLVAVVLALKLLHFLSFFSQGLYNRYGKPSILRVKPNIYPTVENNAWFYFEKVLLEGTFPGDHTLQQRKTVLQLAKSIFSFGCLRIYPAVTPIIQF